MADRGKRHMDKKNVSFSKDGMKVGVKQVNDEDYADKTQRYIHICYCDMLDRLKQNEHGNLRWLTLVFRHSYLVKAWNYSSFPAYKSRLGWNPQPKAAPPASASKTK